MLWHLLQIKIPTLTDACDCTTLFSLMNLKQIWIENNCCYFNMAILMSCYEQKWYLILEEHKDETVNRFRTSSFYLEGFSWLLGR